MTTKPQQFQNWHVQATQTVMLELSFFFLLSFFPGNLICIGSINKYVSRESWGLEEVGETERRGADRGDRERREKMIRVGFLK